jgi:HAD superfamily phosphoserine phosphatase-like hydrolase
MGALVNSNPPTLVAFDVDGTLVDDTVFIWQTLHDHFATCPERRAVTRDAFLRGDITYEEWFDHDIEELVAAGADRAGFAAVLAQMRPMRGARETLAALQARGVSLAVISGSLNIVLDTIFPSHPFADVLINHIDFDDDGRLTKTRATCFDMGRKAEGLSMLAAKHGIPLARCAFVGDHMNDIDAVKLAGLGVAFNYKSQELADVARVRVAGDDLRDVLPYLLAFAAGEPLPEDVR